MLVEETESRPRHVMVDIETLGTQPGSVIVSIAAVEFDPYGESSQALDETFSINVCLESAQRAGLKISATTMLWWMGQTKEAQTKTFFKEGRATLGYALGLFNKWLEKRGEDVRIWAHGAPFDPVLLTTAYEACGNEPSWQFRNIRDTRTLFELADMKDMSEFRGHEGTEHTSLDDAITQARAVIFAHKKLWLS